MARKRTRRRSNPRLSGRLFDHLADFIEGLEKLENKASKLATHLPEEYADQLTRFTDDANELLERLDDMLNEE